MRRIFAVVTLAVGLPLLAPQTPRAASAAGPTIEQFLQPGYPTQVVSARKADRIAWTAYEHGGRNVYTAAPPEFHPTRLTQFTKDDGIELSDLSISDDGATVVFVRGTQPNRVGWIANPTGNPSGVVRTLWAARTAGGAPWKIGEVTTPVLSPDGRSALYAKDGQIYQYPVPQKAAAAAAPSASAAPGAGRTASAAPFFEAWGSNLDPRWSPDGSKVAFVSDRVDHSFIGVYDVRARTVTFLSPSVDHDSSPTWSPDSKRHRLHPTAGHALRAAGAAGHRQPRQSERPRLQSAHGALRPDWPRRPRRREGQSRRRRESASRRAAGPDGGGVCRRIRDVVLGRRRRHRRGERILARREGGQELGRHQRHRVGRSRSRGRSRQSRRSGCAGTP